MNEREDANRFCGAVDDMLAGTTPNTSDHSSEFEVARVMIAMDFTPRSAHLPELQTQILENLSAWEEKQRRVSSRPFPLKIVLFLKKPLPLSALSLCLALVLVQCLTPGGIPAAADYMLSRLNIGRSTSIVIFDDSKMPPHAPAAGTQWRADTPMGGVFDEIRDGAPRDGWHFATFSEARANASAFAFLTPSFVPAGFQLSTVVFSPSKFWLVATYTSSADPDMALVAHDNARAGKVELTGHAGVSVEQLSMNGTPAAWVDGKSLVWEKGPVSYFLGGGNLTRETAVKMAESFQ
jgi:hypothetical protein